MLYDDYEAYLDKYRSEYGEHTVVLMQCGSFYELYDDGSKKTDLKVIGELLNIQVSRRNKAIIEVSRSNLEMAGFPNYTLKKFIHTLVQHDFTCVIVSQTTPPPNPKREVTDIVSPGTYVDEEIHTDSNYLMSIYAEEHEEFKTGKTSIAIGASLIDLGTGRTYVFETMSKHNDLAYPLDEVYRLIVCYNPREFILCGSYKDHQHSLITYQKLVSYLDIDHKCVHDDFAKSKGNLTKLSYQEELMRKVYHNTGMMSCVEYLGLERKPCAQASFVRLLQFVHNHNEVVLNKVKVPQVLEESNTLTLSYNSVKQLDIVPRNANESNPFTSSSSSKSNSLFDILNNCKTAVGRRYFKERMFAPLTCSKALERSYSTIALVLDKKLESEMKVHLQDIYDLERLFRKIDMGSVQPYEIGYVVESVKNIVALAKLLGPHASHLDDCELQHVEASGQDVLKALSDGLVVHELPKCNMDNIAASIFHTGTYPELDALTNDLTTSMAFFDTLTRTLNEMAATKNMGDTIFKLETNERDGHYLLVTQKRFQEFMKMLHGFYDSDTPLMMEGIEFKLTDLSSKAVSHSSTSVKVSLPCFRTLTEKTELLTIRMRKLVTEYYKAFLENLSKELAVHATSITRFLAYVDFYWCCAHNATVYRYQRPVLANAYESKSYITTTGLRHPIIERINDSMKYISNDVSLGIPGLDGILLYGLNSSGKSSLMKSIGIAIVMAQAGMYVACDSMVYYPYEYIFTRIFSSDDIFRGQSTFTKEMMELRGILKRANANSLVLGDELCSGTESISALSIVSAGVHTLATRHTSFVFATHLHDLVTIPVIKALENVKSFHLSVEYNVVSKMLVYDRRLKPGNGSSLYGLEVCKSLHLDGDFLELANHVRQGILGVSPSIIKHGANNNKYNTKIFKDKCQVCEENKATEIHHIAQQKDANEQGYIGNFHKNDKHNLVCLCDKCHNDVHYGTLCIEGYVQTSDGVKVNYSRPESSGDKTNTVERPGPSDTSMHAFITQMLRNNPVLKRKDIISRAQEHFEGASTYKVDKILKSIRG